MSSDTRRPGTIYARLDLIKILTLSLFFASLFIAPPADASEEEAVTYSTLFEVDLAERHEALWKIFEDSEQEQGKLIEKRNIRVVFVGRYDDFSKLFSRETYSRLSLYRSPFQAKMLLVDHYFKKLLNLKKTDVNNKVYLTINDFKKNYFNLYPHIYKKRMTSKKLSIIPNKLFGMDFYEDEKYYDTYQSLFDAITRAVGIKAVKNSSMLPELLDKTSRIKLNGADKFHFYKIEAVVNEALIKSSFDEFFSEMKELTDVINITEFYKLKYRPKIGEDFTPVGERIITINVLYDPYSDFDYYQMEYSKKCALINEYFFREGLTDVKQSPLLAGGAVRLIEVQSVFNATMYPKESMFEFEYDSDHDYYRDVVEDFYDDLDDVMDITEDVITSDELNLEVLKLTATVDELALKELFAEMKLDIMEYLKPK